MNKILNSCICQRLVELRNLKLGCLVSIGYDDAENLVNNDHKEYKKACLEMFNISVLMLSHSI